MPLRSRSAFPPGGWTYIQPETGWSPPNPTCDTFQATCLRIQAHRRANASIGASLDLDEIAADLENFTGRRLNYDPRVWFNEPRPDLALKKKSSRQPPGERSVSAGRVAELVDAVRRFSVGSRTMADWIGDGAFPVSNDLADARASTCAACPMNKVHDDPLSSLSAAVAEAVKSHTHAKRQLKLHLKQEDSISTCSVCGCHLPLKVWVPHRHIARTQSQSTRLALPKTCWMRSEEQRLVVVLPFTEFDFPQAFALLEWINELGGCPMHSCIILADCKVAYDKRESLLHLAMTAFADVEMISTPYPLPDEKWPIGPNWMFATICEHMKDRSQPFFWLEPDCIPLKPHWLETLEAEYTTCGQPFLGNVIKNNDPAHPKINFHINGCAIYPPGSAPIFQPFLWTKSTGGAIIAWDFAAGDNIARLTHNTDLIHHFWGTHQQPPTFANKKLPGSEDHVITPAFLNPKAVLFHRCKDNSLIRCLRDLRNGKVKPA